MANNIFDETISREVSFAQLEQNLVNRGQSRLLSQFQDSELLKSLLKCVSEECQELYNAQIDMLKKRTLTEATGVNLDVIGKLVGADRVLYDYSVIPWFAPDIAGREVDSAFIWEKGASSTGSVTADEELWRNIIFAKIFKNHIVCASTPEIRYFVKIMLDLKVSLSKLGMQELCLVVPVTTPETTIRFLLSTYRNNAIRFSYLLPMPPDVKLNRKYCWLAIQAEDGSFNSFCTDSYGGRPDYAKWTMKSIINTED